MLEVELAALDGWASVGVVPADAVERIRAERASPDARARGRARARDEPRRRGVRRRGRRDARRRRTLVPLRPDLVGRPRHRALARVQDAGALLLEGSTERSRAVVARAEEHRETLCMGRTHGVHAEPTTFGLKLAGWAFALDRDRVRLERALDGLRVGQAVGRRRAVRRDRPGGRADRLRAARAGAGAELDADPAARPARRAALRRSRSSASSLDRFATGDPASRAHRGARGRGAVRPRPEGLVGDAAQAEPDRRRADLRARSRRPCATRSSASRTSRSGTSATSRTRRPSGSSCPTRSSRSTTCSTGSPGSSRASSCGPSACAPTSTRATGSSSASGCCSPSSRAGLARDEAYRLVQRHAMRAWDEELDFESSCARDAEIAGRVDLDRVFDLGAYTRTSTPSSTGSARSSPREGGVVHA